jgi:serine/threonine protein kinase
MALTSGKRLGPYEIVQPLGAGGMGEVYRARDTRLSRDVAIKVLPAHLSSNAEAKQRLEREAHAISALNHPNICTLYDVGHQNGTDYLVMEYLEGVTLADRLSGGPLSVAQVLKYGVEICEGLERAHRTGVVHRDLKPGNIMLTKTGAKLMDFGLAKALAVSASASNLTLSLTSPLSGHAVTSAGTMVGTFQYMAPEQLEGKDASVRSDIFAVGALLYEMVTGKRAFQGNTHASVIASILSSEPPPVSTVEPTSPPALERVIGKCLAKDPDERWQNAGDLASELKWISQPQSSSSFLPRTTARELDTRPVQIAAVAFLVLAIAGWALWFFGAGRKADTNGAVRFSVLPPELHPFVAQGEQSLAISPDGRKLIFAALDNNGRAYLWVRPPPRRMAQSKMETR